MRSTRNSAGKEWEKWAKEVNKAPRENKWKYQNCSVALLEYWFLTLSSDIRDDSAENQFLFKHEGTRLHVRRGMMNVDSLPAQMPSFFMRDVSFSTLFCTHLNKHLINTHLAVIKTSLFRSQFMGHLSKHCILIGCSGVEENYISNFFQVYLIVLGSLIEGWGQKIYLFPPPNVRKWQN